MNLRFTWSLGLMLAPLAGCSLNLSGGGTTVPGESFDGLYVANTDANTIGRYDVEEGRVEQIPTGREPTRVARSGKRIFVTNRGDRTVSVFEEGNTLEPKGVIHTGAEPYGVAARGDRLYVSESMAGTVTEYDVGSGETLRSWEIAGEPRGLALHQSGKALYVVSAFGGKVTSINLGVGTMKTQDLPTITSFNFVDGREFALARRITGDPVITPDGDRLLIPALYIDNETTIPDLPSADHDGTDGARPFPGDCGGAEPPPPDDGGDRRPDTGSGNTEPVEDPEGGEGFAAPPPDPCEPFPPSGGYDAGRFNPVMVEVPLEGGEPEMETASVIQVTSHIEDRFVGFMPVTGYPASITVTPDNRLALLTIEGASAVVAVSIQREDGMNVATPGRAVPPSMGTSGGANAECVGDCGPSPVQQPDFGPTTHFQFRSNVAILTNAGPVGIAILDGDQAFVHSRFDRTVERINLGEVRDFLFGDRPIAGDGPVSGGSTSRGSTSPAPPPTGAPEDDRVGNFEEEPIKDEDGFRQAPEAIALTAQDPVEISPKVFSDEVEYGRRLFFATNDERVSTVGAGVSCGTCHFDARTDGLTWSFVRGKRQTPSLAGNVSLTEPVGWSGDRPTVADDAMMTSQSLMGGFGLRETDAQAMQAFVNSTRHVDNPFAELDDPRIALGKQVFERTDTACVTCHSGAATTTNQIVPMFELPEVSVRSLNGVFATAPYFHDGSAETLRDVVERARDGSMGDTSALTDEEMDALVLYLKTL